MTLSHVRTIGGSALLMMAVFFFGCDGSAPLSEDQTAPEDETKELAESGEKISGQYIVVLNEDHVQAKSEAAVRSIATSLLGKSGTVGPTYATALTGFTASGLTEKQAAALEKKPEVDYVEQDQVIALSPPETNRPPWEDGGGGGSDGQTTPWGVERVDGPVSSFDGDAWVIDTGIDLDHDDLNVDTDRSAVFVSNGPGSKTADDGNGHGTHVAGTIGAIDNDIDVVGVAEGATLVAVKVLDDNGRGSTSDVIDGVDYVAANASAGDVANMSLGGGTSDALDSAVENAAGNGIFFSLAAGNDSEDANNSSPARVEADNVITISAHDSTDTFADFSNYSGPTEPPIEYSQPGVDVLSTYADNGTNTLDGTSMAAPHAAGVALVSLSSGDTLQDNLNTDGTVSNDPDGDPDPIATN